MSLAPIRMAGAALCAVLLFGAAAARAEEARFQGTFANPDQSDAPIDAAIESSISQLNFFARPIARSQVKDANPTFKRVVLDATRDAISVTFDARKPVRMPGDGSAFQWVRDDGETFEVQGRLGERELRQSFKGADGTRVNTFTLSPDGKTLTLEVVLSSERLPAPVQYQLVFQRVER